MTVKTGDYVINFYEDERLIHIGKVTTIHDENEHDMEFFGRGSVSPVDTEDSVVIPKSLALFLDKCINQIPVDEDGMFIFKDAN